MKTVVLISCSKAKRAYPCEARLLYDASSLFSKSLLFAQTISKEIFVLSARYGLVSLNDKIEPYDETLKGKSSVQSSAWGHEVAQQLAERFDIQNTNFIILAGRDYYQPLQVHLPRINLPLGNLQFGSRLAKLDTLIEGNKTGEQNSLCLQLHTLFNSLPRYRWDTINSIPFDNGIYILFENGEKYRNTDRIVRVGTHRSNGRLRRRLKDHFISENKDGSIFRKNIGKAILNENNHAYLRVWNVDTSKPENIIRLGDNYNPAFQKKVEASVSKYMRENFSFVCFPVTTEQERLRLEEGIIATLNNAPDFSASVNWQGKHSTEFEIVQSGLWLKQGLNGTPLSVNEFVIIDSFCLGNYQAPIYKTNFLPSSFINANIGTSKSASADELWKNIIISLSQSPQDICTVTRYGSGGKWIHAKVINNTILVNKAKHNTPSSNMASERTINKTEFTKLYPLYYQWINGNITREQAKGNSMNSSYVFALINKFDA